MLQIHYETTIPLSNTPRLYGSHPTLATHEEQLIAVLAKAIGAATLQQGLLSCKVAQVSGSSHPAGISGAESYRILVSYSILL